MSTVDHGDPGAGSSARSRTRSKGALCYEYDDSESDETRRIRVSNTLNPDEYAIREIDRDARSFDDAPPALPLPGSGDRRDDCGDDFPGLCCPDCGEPAIIGRTCGQSRCPRCWESWDFHSSKTIAAKTDGLRRFRYSRSEGRRHPKNHHIVVSLPPSIRFDSKNPLDRALTLVKLLMAQVDADTGTIIYHPYRIATEYRGDVLGHSSGDGDLTWKDVLTLKDSEGWDAVREEYLVFNPHFHVISVSDWIEGGAVTKRIEKKTGVVIERITPGDSSKSIPDMEALARTTAYALSHAGLSRDEDNDRWQAAYRYFGEVANTEARANVTREVDQALRSVAPTVLGIEMPEPRCSEDRIDADGDDLSDDSPASGVDRPPVRVLTDDSGGAGSLASGGDRNTANTGYADGSGSLTDSGTWDAPGSTTAAGEAVPASIPADTSVSKCNSRLVPMRAAPEFLNDPEWCAGIASSTLARLRSAFATFAALGGGDTDPPPVPPPE